MFVGDKQAPDLQGGDFVDDLSDRRIHRHRKHDGGHNVHHFEIENRLVQRGAGRVQMSTRLRLSRPTGLVAGPSNRASRFGLLRQPVETSLVDDGRRMNSI